MYFYELSHISFGNYKEEYYNQKNFSKIVKIPVFL